jgi:hypothetical protein
MLKTKTPAMKELREMADAQATTRSVADGSIKAFVSRNGMDVILDAAGMILDDFLKTMFSCSNLATVVLHNSDLDFGQLKQVASSLVHSTVTFADLRHNGLTRDENIRLAFDLLENQVR